MIDAHQHFWRIGEHECTWPTADLTRIHRDFMPEDLAPLAQAAGVSGSVLVQSQANDADTNFLLRLADKSNLIKAVVGWVDLSSSNAVERIQFLAQHPKLRGLRPMLQNLPEDSWILQAQLAPAIAAMQACDLSFDALVSVRHLPYLRIFAKRHPKMPMVINHAAKPNIAATGEFVSWARGMVAMAELPQVCVKFSGLLTEASLTQGIDELRPYAVQLYHLFGAERLMWGSDWPVLNMAANDSYRSYSDWLELAQELLPMASAGERAAIFCLSA